MSETLGGADGDTILMIFYQEWQLPIYRTPHGCYFVNQFKPVKNLSSFWGRCKVNPMNQLMNKQDGGQNQIIKKTNLKIKFEVF